MSYHYDLLILNDSGINM